MEFFIASPSTVAPIPFTVLPPLPFPWDKNAVLDNDFTRQTFFPTPGFGFSFRVGGKASAGIEFDHGPVLV
jgi:hypothetical protein